MDPKCETYVDKKDWGHGPWESEPDKMEWRHKGVPCLIVRGPMGALCGYAAVSEGHPYYSKGYSECVVKKCKKKDCYSHSPRLKVHGGLTFADFCHEDGKICHVALPGEPEKVWWFGFDCAHAGDLLPKWNEKREFEGLRGFGDIYATIDYVKREVEHLAEQLMAVK